ncbi:tubulin-like doman-containing protein, partial [Kibdelosporangium lantanae]
MLKPFLFVGVGGSGGDTLRYLHKDLSERLRRVGIAEMPSGWQFLQIDSRTSQEHHDDLPIPESPNYTYVGMVKRDVGYRTVVRLLENNDQNRMALASWRPDPEKVKVPIEEGAGQYRAIGRVLTIARLQYV